MIDRRLDPADLRRALGTFATGVTVVTTMGADGVSDRVSRHPVEGRSRRRGARHARALRARTRAEFLRRVRRRHHIGSREATGRERLSR